MIWAAIAIGLLAAYLKHGKLIGGTQYFAHTGLAGAQLAQLALIGSSIALSCCILLRKNGVGRLLAETVGFVGALFAANFILPLGMGPRIYPLGTMGLVIPLAASIAGFTTASILANVKLSDPTFGTLRLGKFGWSGEAPWLDGTHILVSLLSDPTGPSDAERTAFSELRDTYISLIPRIRSALFTLWQPEMNQPHWEEMAPLTPEALWSKLELNSIDIGSEGRVKLLFAFSGEFWPDGMFNVEVIGSTVRPLSLDD